MTSRKEAVYTDKAPKPVGPYSQGILLDNGLLFISGQIPIDPSTGQLIKEDFRKQVKQVLDNIVAIVEAAGGTVDDIVKVTVYLNNIDKFAEFNEIYSEYFKGVPPARVVVEVSRLPLGVELEVEAFAYIK